MKKIILIIVCLVVLGVILQKSLHFKLEGILKHYDKALVEYQKEDDYKSAYYELNHAFNRIVGVGTSVSDRPLYTTKQISWVGKKLYKRVEFLLPKLAETFPQGIENDWSSTEELRNRYNSFYQKRIAILNSDKAARKQTELVNKFRGVAAPEWLPERLSKKTARKSNDKSLTEPTTKRRQPKRAHLRQQQAQDHALEMMKKAKGTE
ncbi:MAG: hypothetical protein KJN62_05960 [Deltaproteobacteria bacterium]|nr:hypothetical protein [Deltaproteobacteria bacterium]